MSHITTDTDAIAAIERSRTHDEIVIIRVKSRAEARTLVDALREAAAEDEYTDCTDSNEGYEVWGFDDPDSDDTTWRVHVEFK